MSLHTVTGRILNVTTRQLGTSLTAAASVGATLLSVDDCSAFEDDGTGGWVSVNGQVVQFDAVDDDACTIHLLTGLSAAADEGDPIYSWSTLYQQIDDEQTALVQVDGDTDLADPVHADIAEGVGALPDGLRGAAGETCTLTHLSPGVWEITAVAGRPNSAQGVKFFEDSLTVTAGGDQTLDLTYQPIEHSEHVYWNGLYQPSSEWSRSGQTVTIPDPGGVVAAGDILVVEYAYRDSVSTPLLPDVYAQSLGQQHSHSESLTIIDAYASRYPFADVNDANANTGILPQSLLGKFDLAGAAISFVDGTTGDNVTTPLQANSSGATTNPNVHIRITALTDGRNGWHVEIDDNYPIGAPDLDYNDVVFDIWEVTS